jgi:hypothetical protein
MRDLDGAQGRNAGNNEPWLTWNPTSGSGTQEQIRILITERGSITARSSTFALSQRLDVIDEGEYSDTHDRLDDFS